jgi:hypothetical protein
MADLGNHWGTAAERVERVARLMEHLDTKVSSLMAK